METKCCQACGLDKKTDFFEFDSHEPDKLSALCLKCEINFLRKEAEKAKALSDKYKADLEVSEFINTIYHKRNINTQNITPKKLADAFKKVTNNYMASHQGYIYFIVSEDNLKVKIGFTKDNPSNVNEKPISRIKLICSSCHDNPKIYYHTRGSYRIERALQYLYSDYKVDKDVGVEWFYIKEDLRLFMNHLKGRQVFLHGSKAVGRPREKGLS